LENQEHKKFLKDFGVNLTKLRKQHKITRVQLAFEMETHEKQLRLIEKGEINTGILSIYKIAQALHISTSDVLNF